MRRSKAIKVLQYRLDYLISVIEEGYHNSYDEREMGALKFAIIELNKGETK